MDKSALRVVATSYEVSLTEEEADILKTIDLDPLTAIDGVLIIEGIGYYDDESPSFEFTTRGWCCEKIANEVVEALNNLIQEHMKSNKEQELSEELSGLKTQVLNITKKEAETLIENNRLNNLINTVENMHRVHSIKVNFEAAYNPGLAEQTNCPIEITADEKAFDSTFNIITLLFSSTFKDLK